MESNKQTSWTTIAFDVIALFVAASIVFLVTNHVRSVWENRGLHPRSLQPKKGNWLLRHSDALCLLVIAGFAVAFYLNLSNGVLWAADEQTYSQMAYYMSKSGDYLNLHAFGARVLEVNDGLKTIHSLYEASAPVLVKYLSEVE